MAARKGAPKKTEAKQPSYHLAQVFPTNILSRDWENVEGLNERLTNGVWKWRAKDPDGVYRSNAAGTWHSTDALFTELGPAGKELQDMFGQAFVEWGGVHGLKKDNGVRLKMAAWSMIYSDRGYATAHTHPNCHASGVYYVSDDTPAIEQTTVTGVSIRPGDIEFVDTRRGGEFQLPFMQLIPRASVSFKAGRMLIFPSWLPHFVHPVVGPGERISIACNCTFLGTEGSTK